MGLGLKSVPFRFRWDLIEWNPKLDDTRVDLGVKLDEFMEISDGVEEDQAEVFGPQIEIDLETGSDLGEPPIEAAGEVCR